MAAKIHRFMLAAAVMLGASLDALPTISRIFNLADAEAAFYNPENAALAWVVEPTDTGGFDIAHGYLQPIESTPLRTTPLNTNAVPFAMAGTDDAASGVCLTRHQAAASVCNTVIQGLQSAQSTGFHIQPGQTRSVCFNDGHDKCCVSWSANASLDSVDLGNAAAGCFNSCGGARRSCQTQAAQPDGKVLDVCVSNQAGGCGPDYRLRT